MSKAIRVIRVLEYTYPDVDSMVADRAFWQIKDLHRIGKDRWVRSTVMVPEVIDTTAQEVRER